METTAIYAGIFILGFIVGKGITAYAANKMLKEINSEVERVTAILERKNSEVKCRNFFWANEVGPDLLVSDDYDKPHCATTAKADQRDSN